MICSNEDTFKKYVFPQIEKSYSAGKKEAIEEIKKEFGRYELVNIAEILDYFKDKKVIQIAKAKLKDPEFKKVLDKLK